MKISLIKLVKPIVTISLSVLMLYLTACASSKEKVFGTKMQTMKEIHDKKLHVSNGLVREDVERILEDGEEGLNDDVKSAYKQLSEQFSFLPNPVMVMLVYPHLTDAGRPVPTYSTYFTFYEIDQVAILGEAGYE